MPSARVPISSRVVDLDPAGPIRTVLRAVLPVEVRTRGGWFTPIRACVVDSGASYTTMSYRLATLLGLAVPEASSRAPLVTAGGSGLATVRDGELHLRFPQFPGSTFRLYCVFVDGMSETTPVLLGLNDFFDAFRVTFDGRFSPAAPAGHMLLEAD